MADFWSDNPFGKLIRKFGIYAAGTIPFVGALATVVATWADSETFKVKPKTVAPARPQAAAPPKPQPQGGVAIESPLFVNGTGPPPATETVSGNTGGGGSGLDSWFPTPDLPGPAAALPPVAGGSLGSYMAIGAAVLIGLAILVSIVGRK